LPTHLAFEKKVLFAYNCIVVQAAAAIAKFVEEGGGLVMSSFLPTRTSKQSLQDALNPVTPVDFNYGSEGFCTAADDTMIYIDYTHPVFEGVNSDFFTNTHCFWSLGGLKSEAQSIGRISGVHQGHRSFADLFY
jgi:hypothetical protein